MSGVDDGIGGNGLALGGRAMYVIAIMVVIIVATLIIFLAGSMLVHPRTRTITNQGDRLVERMSRLQASKST